MVIGYVLISTEPTTEIEVFKKLSKEPDIIELHPLFGEYDIIAKIKAVNSDKLARIIITKIRSLEGVVNTKTLTGTKFELK
ncbi:MAG: Lrp/AsnC ligand binding domain-containing protein [Thermoplasmatales archaeon]|nr:MAG: Lrp/AsnC ligand binding domain-containing protein [Thermoplasmatales archaeon]